MVLFGVGSGDQVLSGTGFLQAEVGLLVLVDGLVVNGSHDDCLVVLAELPSLIVLVLLSALFLSAVYLLQLSLFLVRYLLGDIG